MQAAQAGGELGNMPILEIAPFGWVSDGRLLICTHGGAHSFPGQFRAALSGARQGRTDFVTLDIHEAVPHAFQVRAPDAAEAATDLKKVRAILRKHLGKSCGLACCRGGCGHC